MRIAHVAAPLPVLDELLRSESYEHTQDDDANFANEGAPAVQRFGQLNMHLGCAPEITEP